MSLKFDYSGKVALITGSSSGIGAATAILFAKSGAHVVVTGRNASKVASVAKQCSEVSPNKSKALEVVADVSNEDDCKRLVSTTIKHFGKLDVLVNNAGFGIATEIIDSNYVDAYKKVMKTNLDSVVYLTHISVEHLAKTKGNIINISGLTSVICMPKLSVGSLSKSAMNMFTNCMAVELGSKGIRVNTINPGAVRTDVLIGMGLDKEKSDTAFDAYDKVYPVGRVGEGEDIANAVLFLASKQASFITGSNLVADGGHLAANVQPQLN